MRVARIRQVKLPVTDLEKSARWYRDLLGLRLAHEFEEQGVVRGVALADPESGVVVGLREREHCEGKPRMDGFDVVAFELESVDAVHEFVPDATKMQLDTERCKTAGRSASRWMCLIPTERSCGLWPANSSAMTSLDCRSETRLRRCTRNLAF